MNNNRKVYYKIGEVCEITNLKPSVLRFWEKEFKEIRPHKTSSNRRLYTKENIEIIEKIKFLLYNKKLTIEGAKKALKSKEDSKAIDAQKIEYIKKELLEILNILKN